MTRDDVRALRTGCTGSQQSFGVSVPMERFRSCFEVGAGCRRCFRRDAASAETPKRGGILTYMIPADAGPSLDGHRETTYAVVHATAPFYSVLIRVNPDNPSSTTRFRVRPVHRDAEAHRQRAHLHVQDPQGREVSRRLAADGAGRGGKLEQDRPSQPKGVASARQNNFVMVDTITAPDDETVVFKLKFATLTFLPALADPYTYIYSKKKLDQDMHWYEKNIMGSGPFKLTDYQIGQSIKGERNPDYYHPGQPYLDGFVGIFAPKQTVRTDAIRADRAALEFRSLPPSARDQLVKELGDKITVQESDWNCGNVVTPNHKRKPFDDVRVRKALFLAIDQWKGAAGAVEDRHHQDRGRHRLPRLAAGRDQGGAADS